MKYWVIINNQQLGPFTLEELRRQAVDAATPVWCKGMADWLPLSSVPELSSILLPPALPSAGAAMPVGAVLLAPAGEIPPGYVPIAVDSASARRKPSGYLVLSILLTVFGTLFIGLVAIFFSWRTIHHRRRGNMAKAFRASERAALWNILNIVLTLIIIPFSAVFGMVDISTFGLM